MNPKLALVIPCYNEEKVLPKTAGLFAAKIRNFVANGLVSAESFVLFCNDGSNDGTWEIIKNLCSEDHIYHGISLSRNRGHQNVLLAGLMEVKDSVDIAISIDCDGQDDVDAMDEMVVKCLQGADIVYGVRNKRATDTWFKRMTSGLSSSIEALGKIAAFKTTMGIIGFSPAVFTILFVWMGFGVPSVGMAYVASRIPLGLVRLYFARRLAGISVRYWLGHVFLPVLFLCLSVCAVAGLPRFILPASFLRIVVTTIVTEMTLFPIAWYVVLSDEERQFVTMRVLSKMNRIRS